MKAQTWGLILGVIGVTCFGLTLPATRMAVRDLDPVIVGLGRSVVAAVLAGLILFFTRQRRPSWKQVGSLYLISLGTVFGFPLLTSWAMKHLPASHGAIVMGLAPLFSSILGVIRMQERPPLLHWLATGAGSLVVIVFAVTSGPGHLLPEDLALLAAAFLVSIGYIEGAKLSKELGAWQVTCWALIVSSPLILAIVGLQASQKNLFVADSVSISSWLGFAYVCLVSQLLVFFAWYRGLALGGVARVSQLQLFQPFLTLFFGALLLDEVIDLKTLAAAFLVVGCIAVSRSKKLVSLSQKLLRNPT